MLEVTLWMMDLNSLYAIKLKNRLAGNLSIDPIYSYTVSRKLGLEFSGIVQFIRRPIYLAISNCYLDSYDTLKNKFRKMK